MSKLPSIAEPPVKAKPSVDMDVLASIHPELMDDSYVYIHCHFNNHTENMLIRIWRTTFIIDKSSSSKGQLIHAENISFAPQWTMVPDRQPFSFLLIFPGLPKSCTQFDMIEEIDQPGGFWVKNIQRNETDVYRVDL
jgi:hypothetical protein